MSLLDSVIAYTRVLASSLLGVASEPVYNLSAIGDFEQDADFDPNKGETSTEQLSYGPLGFIARPLDDDADGFAEAISLRIDGGLTPFGWRDLRLNEMINPDSPGATPAKGQQVFAGYGGAMFSHSMTAATSGSRRANVSVIYVPHDFSGRHPGKAHAIIVDPSPGNSNITIVHANGTRFVLADDTGNGPGLLASVDGTTFLRMTAGELSVNAAKILLKGNVYLGAEAEAGVPLAAGPASPPGPSIFISPV